MLRLLLGWAIALGPLGLAVAGAQEPVPVPLERPERPPTLEEEVLEARDPAVDGWTSETLAAMAGEQLDRVAALLERPQDIREDVLPSLASSRVEAVALRPARFETVLDDGLFVVRRGYGPKLGRTGFAGLARELESLASALDGLDRRRFTFKVIRVDTAERGFRTVALLQGSGRSAERGVEVSTGWAVEWTLPGLGRDQPPLARRILTDRHEEVEVRSPGGTLFADATAAALGADPTFEAQVLPGIDHWAERIGRGLGMSIFGHNGLAVGDVDGDGRDDLYVCDQGGLPNRLYRQQPDGTAVDVAASAGVDFLDGSSSALLVDLDNDGDLDLVVATRVTILFAENDGRGVFSLRQGIGAVPEAYSMAAADFDLDGDLDVYVTAYGAGGARDGGGVAFEGTVPVPYNDARNGGRNALLRNEGGLRFVDATDAVGLSMNNTRFSFAAAWEDYDDDGDPDLYVANDFGRNNLYRNDGGRFVDVAAEAGVEDTAAGMSVSWGDYDRDGRMDLYLGNMFSAAGNRVAYQRRFGQGRSDDDLVLMRRTAGGNTLFRNMGNGTFRDVSADANVKMGRWAWSSPFADLNNDGYEDLLVANGFFTREKADDL